MWAVTDVSHGFLEKRYYCDAGGLCRDSMKSGVISLFRISLLKNPRHESVVDIKNLNLYMIL